jgi:hypothetical protein
MPGQRRRKSGRNDNQTCETRTRHGVRILRSGWSAPQRISPSSRLAARKNRVVNV